MYGERERGTQTYNTHIWVHPSSAIIYIDPRGCLSWYSVYTHKRTDTGAVSPVAAAYAIMAHPREPLHRLLTSSEKKLLCTVERERGRRYILALFTRDRGAQRVSTGVASTAGD